MNNTDSNNIVIIFCSKHHTHTHTHLCSVTLETESKNMASSFWFADNPAEQREEKMFFY